MGGAGAIGVGVLIRTSLRVDVFFGRRRREKVDVVDRSVPLLLAHDVPRGVVALFFPDVRALVPYERRHRQLVVILREVRAVKRHQTIFERVKRVPSRQRLRRGDVQRRALDLLPCQRVDERVLVDDGAAPDVHEHPGGLHGRDHGRVDESLRVVPYERMSNVGVEFKGVS